MKKFRNAAMHMPGKRWAVRRQFTSLIALLMLLLTGVSVAEVYAATVPAGFSETLVTSGLVYPNAMTFAPDGRLFVSESCGKLRVIKNGQLLPTPFVNLTVHCRNERGLLGVTFDPNFAVNRYVYVYYTTNIPDGDTFDIHNRVSRFTANGDVAVAGSERVIFELDEQQSSPNHNGGTIHFGPDGKLYIAVGDNGEKLNSQSLNNLRGKILRINSDGSIPTDNPFYNKTTGKNGSIWALGLRNPFTFAFKPNTNKMYINDVGLTDYEEINEGVAGANYGWPICEGACASPNPEFTDPIYQYSHTEGCAITGAVFYNPPTIQFPADYVGDFFFADWCSGWIKRLDPSTSAVTSFLTGEANPVDIEIAADGSLYYLGHGNNGTVYKIQYTASEAPSILGQPEDQTVAVGQAATFSVSVTGTQPLTYRWQRSNDGVTFTDIPGATSSSYTTPPVTRADDGAKFRSVVENAFGSVTSAAATLNVSTNQLPQATIVSPQAMTTYQGGMTINYEGTGTDEEDGTLPASAFTWEVRFYHHPESDPNHHFHQVIYPTSGMRSGSFTIPTTGETEADVWYRILLTVKDSQGMTHTTFRDVMPQTSTLTFRTEPAGLQITLEGTPRTTPYTTPSVVNVTRQLGAPRQTVNGITYVFDRWSDGGAASHTVSTPAADTTYTAYFKQETSVLNRIFVPFVHVNSTTTTNMVLEPSFESVGKSPWFTPWTVRGDVSATFTQDGTTSTEGTKSMKVSVGAASTTQPWVVQLRQSGKVFNAGTTYTISFDAKASAPRPIGIVLQQSMLPYTEYFARTPNLTTGWARYTYTYTPSANTPNLSLMFNLAQETGDIWIDNVSISY